MMRLFGVYDGRPRRRAGTRLDAGAFVTARPS